VLRVAGAVDRFFIFRLKMLNNSGGDVEEIDHDFIRETNQPLKTGDSSSSSSSSPDPTFEFDGVKYPSYQAMVEAKRERNRLRLVQTTSAVSALFDESKSIGSKSHSPSVGNRKKRKSNSFVGAANDDASTMTPLRRSSRLCGGLKSYKENEEPDQSSETEKPLQKRTKLGKSAAKQASLTPIKSSIEGGSGKMVNNTMHREVVNRGSVIQPPSAPFSLFKHIARNNFIKQGKSKSPFLSKVSLVPHSVYVDMSHTLDHIVMNGYRVRQRDMMLREFQNEEIDRTGRIECNGMCTTEFGNERGQESHENEKNGVPSTCTKTPQLSSIHYEDMELYQPVMDAFIARMQTNDSLNSRDRPHETESSGNCDNFDEDIKIPEEFLLSPGKYGSDPPDHGDAAAMKRPLPFNDSVKFNNVVKNLHNTYLSAGVDRHWDEVYGDGIDPMTFTEETRSRMFVLDRSDHSIHHNDYDTESIEERNYTSLLLQRCWDRAVHTASSSLVVNPTARGDLHGHTSEEKAHAESPPEKSEIGEEWTKSNPRQRREDVASNLHSEALRVVDGLIDILLADGGPIRKVIDSNSQNEVKIPAVDWKHVLECIKVAAADQETSKNGIKIPNESLESISMRLVERYSDFSHKIPP